MARRSRGSVAAQGNEARANPETSLVHLEDCWDEPPPGTARGRLDGERLQGAWASTIARQAVFLVSGNRFTIHFADGAIYMGTFELALKGRPRAMVVRIEEGPLRHKGQMALCFYEFDGDNNLRWCTAGPGRTDRPATFPSADDSDYLSLVFRREQRLEGRRG